MFHIIEFLIKFQIYKIGIISTIFFVILAFIYLIYTTIAILFNISIDKIQISLVVFIGLLQVVYTYIPLNYKKLL